MNEARVEISLPPEVVEEIVVEVVERVIAAIGQQTPPPLSPYLSLAEVAVYLRSRSI